AQKVNLVLVVADGKVGFGLLDLLVGLLHFQRGLFQLGPPLRVVEFDNQIFFFGKASDRGQSGYLDGAEQVRRRQSDRADSAQLASGEGANDDIAALALGGRPPFLPLRQLLEKPVAAIYSSGENQNS